MADVLLRSDGTSRILLGDGVSFILLSADSSVTVALTGQSVSVDAGSLSTSGDVTVGLAGLSMSASPGTLARSSTLQLTGQSTPLSIGTLIAARSIALAGIASTGAVGLLALSRTASLTGQAATPAVGTLTPTIARQLSGIAVTAAQGSVSAGGDITLGLSGQQITAQRGSLSTTRQVPFTGVQAAAAAGDLSAAASVSLAGSQADSATGTVTAETAPVVVVALTGLSMTLPQGDIGIDVAYALVGEHVSAELGAIFPPLPPPPVPRGLPNASPAGKYASTNPWSELLPEGNSYVGSSGLVIGRFAWINAAGMISNQQSDWLGFAVSQAKYLISGYWSDGYLVLPPGCLATLISSGDVWARFAHGASPGDRVYADVLTGKAIAGYSPAAVPTPWWVVTAAGPGELAIISTTSRVQ